MQGHAEHIGKLFTFARMGLYVSAITSHSKEWKMALTLLEVVGIFWGNVAFAHSAIMLHARYSL